MKLITPFILLTSALLSIWVTAKADVSEASALQRSRQIIEAVGIRNNVKLVFKGTQNWGRPLRLSGPPNDPWREVEHDPKALCYSFKFEEGEKLKERITVDISVKTGKIINYSWTRYAMTIGQKPNIFSGEMCEKKALEWMQKVGEPLPNNSCLYQSESPREHIWSSAWRRCLIVDDTSVFLPPYIDAEVNQQTGILTTYHVLDWDVTLPNFQHKISKDIAIKLARRATQEYRGETALGGIAGSMQRAVLTTLGTPAYQGHPAQERLLWEIKFIKGSVKGTGLVGEALKDFPADWKVGLDADTGEILNCEFNVERRNLEFPSNLPTPHIFVRSYSPTWMSDSSLVFLNQYDSRTANTVNDSNANETSLPLANEDSYAKKTEVALYASPVHRFSLLKLPIHDVSSFAYAPDTRRIAWAMHASIYILDLKTGSIGRCNDPLRVHRSMPNWNLSGNLLAMSGTHSPADLVGTDDTDIFVAEISKDLSAASMNSNRCIVHLSGRNVLPVFIPNGKSIVFAHEDLTSKSTEEPTTQTGRNWTLCLVKPNKSYKTKDYEPPQEIIDGLSMPERLSFFPDGKRVLISYSDNEYAMKNPPEIVDVEAKTRKPLNLPILHDPDLAKSQPLIVREPAIDPSGAKIAFRALRWSGNPKDDGAICIYTCNLDGSDLKRITPPTAQPLEPYKYPQPGITALNAWEKLEPKPNLGTPVVPGTATTH